MNTTQKFSIGETVRIKKTGALAEILFYDPSDKTYRVDLKASTGSLWYPETEIEPCATSAQLPRVIKFRGKDIKTGEWLYGDLVHAADGKRTAILVSDRDCYDECETNPSTTGQYTGLNDVNGKEIYEGDIVVYGEQCKHIVEFKHGMFGYTLMDGWFVGYGGNSNFTFNPLNYSKEHKIIGNIHDNPELIKKQPGAK